MTRPILPPPLGFDPSFLAPVRSMVSPSAEQFCRARADGTADDPVREKRGRGTRRGGLSAHRIARTGVSAPHILNRVKECLTNCRKLTNRARLKRAGPNTGSRKNSFTSKRPRPARLGPYSLCFCL